MSSDQRKRLAAEAALTHVTEDMVLGVGTGSTTDHFIDALALRKLRIRGAVASSVGTANKLRQHGIALLDLNDTGELELYVDGADESDPKLRLIKGGGGALTREKIIAAASRRFICIVDESKLVTQLGKFPLPIEVIPMARAYLMRRLVGLGARPVWRQTFVTDNGNHILDVHDLGNFDPPALESEISSWAGVVTVGLFAHRCADLLIIGGQDGTRTLEAPRA
jgi:ribose 5-phosphate isomerase A